MKRTCRYCGTTAWFSTDEGVTSAGSIRHDPCACGKSHSCCRLCWDKISRVMGEFPKQKQLLRHCPESP